MHLAESMIEAEKEIELETLQKIAACFEKGDYVTAKGLADRITYAGLQVYPEEWSFLRRSMQAARLAEDGA